MRLRSRDGLSLQAAVYLLGGDGRGLRQLALLDLLLDHAQLRELFLFLLLQFLLDVHPRADAGPFVF